LYQKETPKNGEFKTGYFWIESVQFFENLNTKLVFAFELNGFLRHFLFFFRKKIKHLENNTPKRCQWLVLLIGR
jgi:hypothetical protein